MRTDLALQLLCHGYAALPRLWDDPVVSRPEELPLATTTRLLGRPALVVRGPEGVGLFYDEDLVEREGVVPRPLADLLFGPGAVHGLDGEEHEARKDLFLRSWGPGEVQRLGDQVEAGLREVVAGWPTRVPVSLHQELTRVYGTAVLRWVGVEEDAAQAERLSLAMARVVDGFGFSPRAYARGWAARLWLDRWAAAVVEEVRAGGRPVPRSGILRTLAVEGGADLDRRTAGVELLNVLRPTVAVAWLGTYAVRALVDHPEHGPRLSDPEDGEARRAFAQEVRRLTRFVPALAGRLRHDLVWGGRTARAGDLLVLDVPGTNRDPRSWPRPEAFLPGRHAGAPPGPDRLVPQGGGPARGHRCPGEDVALTLLERTLLVLSRTELTVGAAPVPPGRVPGLPPGGLVVTRARPLDGASKALTATPA